MSKRKQKHKEDKSPKIPQRDKISKNLTVRELSWTDKQKEFISLALSKETKVMFVSGPAGSAKTLMAVYSCLRMLGDKKVSDVVYLRSAVESSDAKIGFLPGDVGEKLAFYNVPLEEKLNELLPKDQVSAVTQDSRVISYPVSFARGLNWNAKAIIFDECQNSSAKEIITILTRLGEYSHAFILADPMQTDLRSGVGGFERIVAALDNEESRNQGIHVFRFTEEDIKRSALVKYLAKALKNVK
jgi:phosphate starvation-inducible protein PhoH and related proteins